MTVSTDTTPLTALVLVCTLTPSPADSSSELLGRQVLQALGEHGVTGDVVRVVDHDVKRGVEADMGDGDEWPALRQRVLDADILVVAAPIWMGHPSSVTQQVLERLDADIAETDDQGRPIMSGRVAAIAVVGNEDGAHHVVAEVAQGLNDVGFTLAAGAGTYWVGEAMGSVDYQDLDETPEKVASQNSSLAANTAHLARLLKASPYPAQG
ncbi:NAD(P)H-dependent oxidoreductase [Angustibacter speluncae]